MPLHSCEKVLRPGLTIRAIFELSFFLLSVVDPRRVIELAWRSSFVINLTGRGNKRSDVRNGRK
jgi:hypothetical protein